MERVTDAAAAVESTADALSAALDGARLAHSPAVPPTQLRVLTILATAPRTNMNGLAEALGVVPSSASRLCDRLEAAGLLQRVTDPRDRREVRLHLTAAALRLLEDIRVSRRSALVAVLEQMSPADRAALVRGLAAFDAAVEPAYDGAGLQSA